jgi:hypothetical protein
VKNISFCNQHSRSTGSCSYIVSSYNEELNFIIIIIISSNSSTIVVVATTTAVLVTAAAAAVVALALALAL